MDTTTITISDSTSAIVNQPPLPIVRPSRTKVLPTKFKDFTGLPDSVVANSNGANMCVHPLNKYISNHVFRKPYVNFLANIHKHWVDAMTA